jgi:hypothetical protein
VQLAHDHPRRQLNERAEHHGFWPPPKRAAHGRRSFESKSSNARQILAPRVHVIRAVPSQSYATRNDRADQSHSDGNRTCMTSQLESHVQRFVATTIEFLNELAELGAQ